MAQEEERAGGLKKTAGIAALSAVAGAVAGMMLTPKSGRDMRNSMKGKVHDMKDKTKQKIDKVK